MHALISRRAVTIVAVALALALPASAQGKKGGSGGESAPKAAGISGQYRAIGRDPDGTEYSGIAYIIEQGDAIEMEWRVSGDPIRGQGVREGRVVIVDWGDSTPVVYVIMPNGELHGTWASGTALERLIPN